MSHWRIVLWALAGVAAAIGAWSVLRGNVVARALTPVDLGALTLSLPEGTETAGRYAYGKVIVPDGLGVALVVIWRPGALQADDLIDRVERAAAATQTDAAPTIERVRLDVGGLPAKSVRTRADGYASDMTQLVCGGLRFTVRMVGRADAMSERHLAIVESARCHPDPARAGDVTAPPAVVPLPEGWKAVKPKEAQVVYAGDGATLALQSLELADPDRFAEPMRAAVKKLGAELTYGEREETTTADGERWLWPTTLKRAEGTVEEGMTALWSCGDAGPWIMAQLTEPAAVASAAATTPRRWGSPRALLLAITCSPQDGVHGR